MYASRSTRVHHFDLHVSFFSVSEHSCANSHHHELELPETMGCANVMIMKSALGLL